MKILRLSFFCVLIFIGLWAHGAEEIHPEVLEALHEAPEVVEELVLAPSPKGSASSVSFVALVFGLTFLIEEVAISASAYFIGTERLSSVAGFLPLFIGIFLSDIALYVAGAWIARSRWLRGYVDVPSYQRQVGRHLDRGMWMTILISRLAPGMLIPIFLMLGFSRANFKLVAFVTFCITGIYSAVALYGLLYMGLQISDLLGAEALAALALLAVFYIFRNEIRRSVRTWLRRRRLPSPPPWPPAPLRGLPDLQVPRARTFFESLPSGLSYAPIVLGYFWNALCFRSLSAPLAANPGIENAGICGESKSRILQAFPPRFAEHLPRFIAFTVPEDLASLDVLNLVAQAELAFPIVAKPDIGYMSRGVELIADADALTEYLERFPQNQTVILQAYVPWPAEAGVFYARPPSRERAVVRVAMTYFPFVIGDGRRTTRELVECDPRFAPHLEDFAGEALDFVPGAGQVTRLKLSGSTRDGSIHTEFTLPADAPLIARIDEICRALPEFWIGRFDVKFESVAELLAGRFQILELNGASGEDLTAWDPARGAAHAYRTLFRQMRWIFEIGLANRRRGVTAISGGALLKAYIEQESLLFRLLERTRERRRARGGGGAE